MSYGSELIDDMRAESAYHEYMAEECIVKGVWVTKDGRKIPVEDMTDAHLLNSLRMMLRGGSGCFYGVAGEATVMLACEVLRRGFDWRG